MRSKHRMIIASGLIWTERRGRGALHQPVRLDGAFRGWKAIPTYALFKVMCLQPDLLLFYLDGHPCELSPPPLTQGILAA